MAIPHKCPVCDGSGKVQKPPWVGGDQPTWTTTDCGLHTCNGCSGSGVVWEPEPKSGWGDEATGARLEQVREELLKTQRGSQKCTNIMCHPDYTPMVGD